MKRKLKEFNVIEHLDSDEARVEYLREALRSVKEEPSGDAESDKKWLAKAICDIAKSVGIDLSPMQAELNEINNSMISNYEGMIRKYEELVRTKEDYISTMNWIITTTADRITDIGQKMKFLVEKDKK